MTVPRVLLQLLCLLGLLFTSASRAADVPLTPVQAAYFNAETRKANQAFVSRVAQITGSPESVVRKAMPPEGRIADPAARVVSTLEAQRNQVLPEEMKAQIAAAERDRRAAIATAREAARSK